MKLWGGRFEEGPNEVFQRFSWSLHFDRRLFEADIAGSQAWARALARAGILTDGEADTLCRALSEVPPPPADAPDEDIHTYVIRVLKEKTGALASKIHTGRSRNEQVSLDTRLWLRGTIDRCAASLRALMGALLESAQPHTATVIPGYTHLQQAQPILLAHWFLSFFWKLERDQERLCEVERHTSVLPLGAGALAGNPLGVDRQALADELPAQAAAQVTYVNPVTGADAENILGFHALMLRPGQTLALPARSPALVLHQIEGGTEVHVEAPPGAAFATMTHALDEADTCAIPGYTPLVLVNRSATEASYLFLADESPLHRKLGLYEVRPDPAQPMLGQLAAGLP